MRVRRGGQLGWWSPDPRGVIPLDGLVVSRSLRRSCRRFDVTVDDDFRAVMAACGDPSRPDGWIDDSFLDAYSRLHDLGWAHSIEVWADGAARRELVGGLYGLAIGGLFAGESMFHTRTDASKVALVATVERLASGGGTMFDVQWATPHLTSLGATELPRQRYLAAVAEAVLQPQLTLD
jgi:leucyl/phenylalanyl-tRNA--protein transferase